MTAAARTTIAFNDETLERLKSVAEKHKISYARMIGCLLFQSDEEIARVVAENYPRLYQSRAEKKEREKKLLSLVGGLDPTALEALLTKANQQ